ncbi:hypothetical protein ON010_g12823 [Phytophthora cinnamomi]|nr:hypothetical protein ON010_g12823 [Phytophthora cinnamomi]
MSQHHLGHLTSCLRGNGAAHPFPCRGDPGGRLCHLRGDDDTHLDRTDVSLVRGDRSSDDHAPCVRALAVRACTRAPPTPAGLAEHAPAICALGQGGHIARASRLNILRRQDSASKAVARTDWLGSGL